MLSQFHHVNTEGPFTSSESERKRENFFWVFLKFFFDIFRLFFDLFRFRVRSRSVWTDLNIESYKTCLLLFKSRSHNRTVWTDFQFRNNGWFTLHRTGTRTGTGTRWVSILRYELYTPHRVRDKEWEPFYPFQSLSRSLSRTVCMSHKSWLVHMLILR